MRFDVIIGNPPYHLETKGNCKQADNSKGKSNQSKPIYDQFVKQAKKLKPRYMSFIIPSRWFAGGIGLDEFKNEMINDTSITNITDFINSKDCFSQNSISGGIPGNGVSGRLLLQIAFTEILLAAIPHDAAGNQRNIQKQCFCNAQEVK